MPRLNNADVCSCGLPLPTHIAQLADGWGNKKYSHVCTCERLWLRLDKQWVQDGTKHNPFKNMEEALK